VLKTNPLSSSGVKDDRRSTIEANLENGRDEPTIRPAALRRSRPSAMDVETVESALMVKEQPEQIRRVDRGDVHYALFCRQVRADAVRFLTSAEDDFQAGIIEQPAGYEFGAHRHPCHAKVIDSCSEFLYLESGAIRVRIFDEGWEELADEPMGRGDFVVFFRGGHAVSVTSSARMIVVKQGPYDGDPAAKLFRDSNSR
jgi:hypothetical protein